MNNQIMTLLMNQLKTRNPQGFQNLNNFIQNKGDPKVLFKQITNNFTPEQMDKLYANAKQFGITEDLIKQVQE